jgi:predicted metal-dependent hydrolase
MQYKEFSFKHIVNKKLKNSSISVDAYGNITVKTPFKEEKRLFALLAQKEMWLRKVMQKEFQKQPILGKEYELFGAIENVQKSPKLSKILNNMKSTSIQNMEKAYERFYKEEAKAYILPRTKYFQEKMSLSPKEIRFRKMKRRWGSCSKDGIIIFNTNLIKKDKSFIDEVIVHELAHLVHFNHSKAFHELVAFYL